MKQYTSPYGKERARGSWPYDAGNPKLLLCANLEGWDGEGSLGRGSGWGGTHVRLWPIHIISQFSRSVESDSLQPHGLQHARPPCPSPTPGPCSNSCPSSPWCRLTNSSSVAPFSSRLSQHQGLFWWVTSWHQVAKGLELQLQYQSCQWIFILMYGKNHHNNVK